MSSREGLIRRLARQRGLDPNAVIADSMGEGRAALYGGNSIGDHGTSFGPFQLHAGGALPAAVAARGAAYANRWANSKAGISYALDQMVKDGAAGLTGNAAVAAIVKNFERPSDIPGQTKLRQSYLSSASRPGGGVGPVTFPPTSDGKGGLGPLRSSPFATDPKAAVVATLLTGATQAAQGQVPDFGGILQIVQARQAQQAANDVYGPQGATGPLTLPNVKGGKVKIVGNTKGVSSGFLNRVAQAASASGATQIRVISGYRSPQHNAAIGGAEHSLHTAGEALDAQALVNGKWVPLGALLQNTAGKFGIRSGDQPGFFHGAPDPNHVDSGGVRI